MSTPVRLTPRGGIIKLSPLKNLLSADHGPTQESLAPNVDEHDGPEQEEEEEEGESHQQLDSQAGEQQLGRREITMSLNGVCSKGQQMKFSIPGVHHHQALTLNFSAEALQVFLNC